MKYIILSLLICNICYADMNIIPVINYKSCRQDFAVKLCKKYPDTYSCFKFRKKGQDYITWEEAFRTSGERVKVLVEKTNRRNSLIWRNHCVAIPNDLSKNELIYAPFPLNINNKEKHILIDLNQFAWGAYLGGKLLNWSIANGGAGICKETGKYECKTPAGEHYIYKIKRGFARSSLYPVKCENKKECGHPYFNPIFFGKSKGEAIHGEYNGHIFGENVSHGCVRTDKKSSMWLVDNFVEIGTKVIVLKY